MEDVINVLLIFHLFHYCNICLFDYLDFQTGYHAEKLVLEYNVNDTQYILDLILNKELIPKNAFIEHQSGGKSVTTEITGKVYKI